METIGTLINNLKTKLDEQANDKVLLGIANEIVLQLQLKLGQESPKYNVPVPTLVYQSKPVTSVKKEVDLNEIKEEKSLNDVLKEQKTEVSQVLENTPVHDLRKAININDRFVFINELFAGNENLYEQSVKILNDISNLKDAEDWIAKELRPKLNLNEETDVVQQFYKLIKRRYS